MASMLSRPLSRGLRRHPRQPPASQPSRARPGKWPEGMRTRLLSANPSGRAAAFRRLPLWRVFSPARIRFGISRMQSQPRGAPVWTRSSNRTGRGPRLLHLLPPDAPPPECRYLGLQAVAHEVGFPPGGSAKARHPRPASATGNPGTPRTNARSAAASPRHGDCTGTRNRQETGCPANLLRMPSMTRCAAAAAEIRPVLMTRS